MHIVLLNEYFPPDTAATAKVARSMVDVFAEKHRVTVLAGRPSYDPSERHGPYLIRREVAGNVTVERVGSTAFSRVGMKGRVLNYLSYLALAIPRALTLQSDVILAMTDPPFEGIAGAVVAKLSGRPFVYNPNDMYPDMALGGGIVRPSSATRGWEAAHRWALKRAAKVVVLGEDMRERILAKGVNADRIAIVRHAAPYPESLPPSDHPVAREIRGSFRFVLVHAGNLGFYGAWETLIRGVKALAADGVGLVFIGEGAMKTRVQELARDCTNVRFLPFRPSGEVPYVMAAGDLQVVTVKRGLEGVVVPSKVYGILAAGRPILAVATMETEVARFANRDGCGICADPDDPAAVTSAIQNILYAPERLQQMSAHARALAKTYDRVKELQYFLTTIEDAVGALPQNRQ